MPVNDTITNTPVTSINGPKVGDILVATYGHEANIANFAKVVAVTKSSVKIRAIGSTDTHTGIMEWVSVPNENRVSDEIQTRRFRLHSNGQYSVKHSSFSTYFIWKGQPERCYNHH